MVLKVAQPQVSDAISRVQWTLQGDDMDAVGETRRRAKLAGPVCVAFLVHVVMSDSFASPVQRVRAAVVLLEAGEFIASAAKTPTGLFDGDAEADGGDRKAI
jgi:hypothetical protein